MMEVNLVLHLAWNTPQCQADVTVAVICVKNKERVKLVIKTLSGSSKSEKVAMHHG
jgi:hypothetical protein